MGNLKKKKYPAIKSLFFLGLGIFMLTSGILIVWGSSLEIPSFDSFEERRVSESTKIYDRTGKVALYDIHENVKRRIVPYGDISRFAKNATVAIEDAEFYEHHGIKPTSILRAMLVNVGGLKFSQGGSTITQQVVKNSLLTSEKKISRKLKEWVLAIKLERVLSKDDILGIYLNEAPYGGNIYGIEEASLSFFGKSARDLNLAEAAYLAALPQAPTYYSPYGNNKKRLEERKNLVLQRMFDLGFISQGEFDAALKEQVTFLSQPETGIHAPHFVIFVRSYLEEKYGKEAVESEGLRVVTTLDYEMQKKAEEIVKKYALENKEKFNAENASLVAIDPKTGQILAMVGSRDYFDKEIDGNFNIALTHRQPGSAFKPFVYATAFEKGYTPETTVFDLQTEFQTTCDPDGNPLPGEKEENCYRPENYDHVFRGPISLRNALAQSINVPAIKTLYLAGIADSLKTARDLGITSLTDPNRYGLTLVLGGGEVSLLEMTSAYGVFANDGVRNRYEKILRIEDKNGNILEEWKQNSERVLPENIAREINDILSDNEARSPAFGERSYLYFDGKTVAAKTGTTNDYRDAWIIGYTPSIAVGAWVGNNDNSPMEKKVAGFIVAPMWNAFMTERLKDSPDEKFVKPEEIDQKIKPALRGFWQGGENYFIDKISGRLATEYTPVETREERVVTDIHSILYWVDKQNPTGPKPESPEKDPQFILWETPIRKWAQERGLVGDNSGSVPKEYDNVHRPELSPKIKIETPKSGFTFEPGDKININISNQGGFPLVKVEFYVNNQLVGTSSRLPFGFSFVPEELSLGGGEFGLRVVGYDSVFNRGEDTVLFSVK